MIRPRSKLLSLLRAVHLGIHCFLIRLLDTFAATLREIRKLIMYVYIILSALSLGAVGLALYLTYSDVKVRCDRTANAISAKQLMLLKRGRITFYVTATCTSSSSKNRKVLLQ